jgi:hypothetical protein
MKTPMSVRGDHQLRWTLVDDGPAGMTDADRALVEHIVSLPWDEQVLFARGGGTCRQDVLAKVREWQPRLSSFEALMMARLLR